MKFRNYGQIDSKTEERYDVLRSECDYYQDWLGNHQGKDFCKRIGGAVGVPNGQLALENISSNEMNGSISSGRQGRSVGVGGVLGGSLGPTGNGSSRLPPSGYQKQTSVVGQTIVKLEPLGG